MVFAMIGHDFGSGYCFAVEVSHSSKLTKPSNKCLGTKWALGHDPRLRELMEVRRYRVEKKRKNTTASLQTPLGFQPNVNNLITSRTKLDWTWSALYHQNRCILSKLTMTNRRIRQKEAEQNPEHPSCLARYSTWCTHPFILTHLKLVGQSTPTSR